MQERVPEEPKTPSPEQRQSAVQRMKEHVAHQLAKEEDDTPVATPNETPDVITEPPDTENPKAVKLQSTTPEEA